MTRLVPAALLLGFVLAPVGAASAQPAPWPGSIDVSLGAGFTGSRPLGAATATLRTNEVPAGGPFTLFETSSTAARAGEVAAGIAWRLTPAFALQGRVSFARPAVRTSVRADPESPGATFTGQRYSAYGFEGGVAWSLTRLAFAGGRAVPYASGGAGYLRELHEGRTLVDHGRAIYAGGGVRWLLASRERGRVNGLGFRVDTRATMRKGGVDFERARWRTVGRLGADLLIVF